MIGDQLPQHRDEAVDGVGRLAVGAGQPADRVVRAIHLRAAVDQEQTRRRGHQAGKLQYIIRVMRFRLRAALLAVLMAAATRAAAAATRPARPAVRIRRGSRRSRLDGSATLVVNASIPALVALRGFSARYRPARASRPARAAAYATLYHVTVRGGRARRAVDASRAAGSSASACGFRTSASLPKAAPFSWANYELRAAGRPDVLQAHARRARRATPRP